MDQSMPGNKYFVNIDACIQVFKYCECISHLRTASSISQGQLVAPTKCRCNIYSNYITYLYILINSRSPDEVDAPSTCTYTNCIGREGGYEQYLSHKFSLQSPRGLVFVILWFIIYWYTHIFAIKYLCLWYPIYSENTRMNFFYLPCRHESIDFVEKYLLQNNIYKLYRVYHTTEGCFDLAKLNNAWFVYTSHMITKLNAYSSIHT